jgi:nucleotide-binding universal stress UspA family protein
MERQRVVVLVEDAAAARAALQWAVGNFIRGGDCITLLHVCPPARSRRRRRSLRLRGFQLALAFKDLCNGIAEVRNLTDRVGWIVLLSGWPEEGEEEPVINPRGVAVAPRISPFCSVSRTNATWFDPWTVQAKVEIVVTEGELGETVVATVNKLGATTLVVGLHDRSFLYRWPVSFPNSTAFWALNSWLVSELFFSVSSSSSRAPSPYVRVRSLGCRVLAVRQRATARDGFLNAELTQIETISLQ